jgi:hypothetical protein
VLVGQLVGRQARFAFQRRRGAEAEKGTAQAAGDAGRPADKGTARRAGQIGTGAQKANLAAAAASASWQG